MANQVASNPKLIEACLFWDKITEALMSLEKGGKVDLSNLRPAGNYIYSENDYRPLACRIDGNVAQVTVGSSPGHATHIVLEEGAGRIAYYDVDKTVNEIMKGLLESEANMECTVVEGGVDCKGLKEDKLKDLFRVLAMPTSMDLRQQFCREIAGQLEGYCVKRERQLFEQIKSMFK